LDTCPHFNFVPRLPAAIALAIFGIPAAILQHRYSPIVKDPARDISIEWMRVLIVAMIVKTRAPPAAAF
jgi:hypothetical protein